MADFRKLFLALIAGALLLGTVASAADYSCAVSAVPTIVRSEGVADLAGDILLSCSGDPLPIPTIANVRLQIPGTKITSRIVGTANNPLQNVLEALLLLDEPNPATTNPPRGYDSVSPSLDPYDDGSQNVYQAVWISDDTIEWQGVDLAGSFTGSRRSIRLTNVRINPIGYTVGQQIQAIVQIQTSSAGIPVTPSNVVPSVALVQRGLFVKYSPLECNNCSPEQFQGNIGVTLKEGFATAFKPRSNNYAGYGVAHSTPGGSYLDESGYNPIWVTVGNPPPNGGPLSGGGLLIGLGASTNTIGVATQGTHFKVTIINVPPGVTLTAPNSVTGANGLQLTLIASTGSPAGGTWTFTYEVGSYQNPNLSQFQVDVITINIAVSFVPPVPVTVLPVTAHTRFDPLSTADGASLTAPVPRFNDSTTEDDKPVLIIQNCKTVLLFPYLVQLGSSWDSGIAISNTSVDPFGTVNQDGACDLYFYGQANGATVNGNVAGNQGKQVTPTIPAGGQFVMTLSGGGGVLGIDGTWTACSGANCVLPEFRGYMIASCNFQYGHGFAFISDMGAQKLSQGYLALVIPYRQSMYPPNPGGRPAQWAGVGAGANQGEGLGN
ncbi:MAG: hypothetical protein ACUVXB_15950 [Bryobacteraceae bacterium]